MKLTKMADGRILLEVAGHAHALPAFEVSQLTDQLGVKPVGWGLVRGLRRELDEERERVDAYAEGAESLRQTIADLRGELESAKAKAHEFWLMAADREVELVQLREYVAAARGETEDRECTFRDLDAAGNCRCRCGYNSDQARWAELDDTDRKA